MKGSILLALSSYMLVAGCAPSGVPTPEPLEAPAISVEEAAPESESGVMLQSAVKSASPDTLSVRIHGPAALRSAATASYRASVANGDRASHHYYWWFLASCDKSGSCLPSSYRLLSEGMDDSTVTLRFTAATAEKDLVVQVAEADGQRRTGSSAEFPILGPVQRQGGGANGFAGGVCDWYAGEFYPHVGDYTDPFTGGKWQRRFRRDYCGNRVSWDPQG